MVGMNQQKVYVLIVLVAMSKLKSSGNKLGRNNNQREVIS
jgi:hypothetical protein